MKQQFLDLVNAERQDAGVAPLGVGENDAPQLQAEELLASCVMSHWNAGGLKPYHRYTLTGGQHDVVVRWMGRNACIGENDGYPTVDIAQKIEDAVETLKESENTFESRFLNSDFRRLSIGLAWDKYNYVIYPQLETDHISYREPPAISDGELSLHGALKTGLKFRDEQGIYVTINYDPPAQALTAGQLARTFCYDYGARVASLRPPLHEDWYYTEDETGRWYRPCPSPYEVPRDAPVPGSYAEQVEVRREVREAERKSISSRVYLITASTWVIGDKSFLVTADFKKVLNKHGPGIYTVLLWLRDEDTEIGTLVSTYSIFYDP